MPQDATDSITRMARTTLETGVDSATRFSRLGPDGLSIPGPFGACNCRAYRHPSVSKRPSETVAYAPLGQRDRDGDPGRGIQNCITRKNCCQTYVTIGVLLLHAPVPQDQAARGHR